MEQKENVMKGNFQISDNEITQYDIVDHVLRPRIKINLAVPSLEGMM